MTVMTYPVTLEKHRYPTAETPARVQKDSHLNYILMLGDCVGE